MAFLLLAGATGASGAETNDVPALLRRAVAADALPVARVWAGHPVGFALFTHPPDQFVAFYDDHRRLTVAQRRLTERTWSFSTLPDTTGWDSHNYLTMTADDDGYLHLSGDMHAVPLKYFRSEKPWDGGTFARVDRLIGTQEARVTYPQFFRGPQKELIFTYRDGGSGNGNQIYDVYDTAGRRWERLLDAPLTDGEGRRNAYFDGPVRGPDGWYHMAWVWRESPDAASNHDLSYARSRDLRHWETSAGAPLRLPITLRTSEIVDPVPVHGGMINGNTRLGFDTRGRVTISYIKYDAAGNTQPWTARLENGVWQKHQITDWPWRWDFGGGGSLVFGIRLGPVHREEDGELTESFSHAQFGSGTWRIDPETLRAVGRVQRQETPPELGRVEGAFPGLEVQWAGDAGASGQPGVVYKLRWETLPPNRDHARAGRLPGASALRLEEIRYVSP